MTTFKNMQVITEFGDFYLNGSISGTENNYKIIDNTYTFSDELTNIIGGVWNAGQLFFNDNIDLTLLDNELSDEINEEIEILVALGDKEEPIRVLALSNHTDESIMDIEENDIESYTVNGEDYYVLNDSEATEKAIERTKDLIDDIGFDNFSESAKQYALDNFVDTDWFDDALREMKESYAYDIQSENANDSDIYVNRLHEEMVEENIMDEPDYPEEPDEDDFEHDREEFDTSDICAEIEDEEPEPFDEEHDDADEWQDEYDTWEQKLADAEEEWNDEQDRLEQEAQEEYEKAVEEWEQETEDYRSELEDDVENNIDSFVDKLVDNEEDSVEYYNINFGNLAEVVKNNGLLDEDDFAEWLVDQDGRGTAISSVDGEENEETVTFNGKTETFYIYKY